MLRNLILSAAGLLIATQSEATPDQDKLIARIEATVRLPRGARPLSTYSRYYWWGTPGKTVEAIYITAQRAGTRWLRKENPSLRAPDRGCGTIFVRFELRTGVASAACDGIA